jgi:predicted GNAT family N-acyltransferase
MAWIYNDDKIAILYQKWAKFGWLVSEPTYEGEVDLEELIAETTWAARYDGRLMKWLMTWFKDYGDLVNKKRLLRYMKDTDTAVLGAIIGIAMNRGADKNFKTVLAKCRAHKPVEVFQKGMEDAEIYIEGQKKYGKPEFKKWGFYCTMIEFYTDAQRGREWILKNNELLGLRAIFGVNIRSEIIYTLHIFNGIAIRKLSKLIGYAYSGVYREIENMATNGLIEENSGNGRILKLSEKMNNLLKTAA